MWRMIPFLVLVLTVSVTTPGQTSDEDDWPMYGRNLQHTFSNPSSAITPENVSTLQQAWSFQTGDVVSASPTVVGGVVYVGAWDGFFYALDARTGSPIWRFQVDCQNTVVPVPPSVWDQASPRRIASSPTAV